MYSPHDRPVQIVYLHIVTFRIENFKFISMNNNKTSGTAKTNIIVDIHSMKGLI